MAITDPGQQVVRLLLRTGLWIKLAWSDSDVIVGKIEDFIQISSKVG